MNLKRFHGFCFHIISSNSTHYISLPQSPIHDLNMDQKSPASAGMRAVMHVLALG